jgi:hypothetical protein
MFSRLHERGEIEREDVNQSCVYIKLIQLTRGMKQGINTGIKSLASALRDLLPHLPQEFLLIVIAPWWCMKRVAGYLSATVF